MWHGTTAAGRGASPARPPHKARKARTRTERDAAPASLTTRVKAAQVLNDNSDNGTIYVDPAFPTTRVIKASKTAEGAREMRQEVEWQRALPDIAPTVHEVDATRPARTLYSMDRLQPIDRWDPSMLPPLIDLVRKLVVDHHLVHNDLHQGNLMRTASGTLRLIDFGESRELPRGALRAGVLKLLLVAQLAPLLDKCNKNNVVCPRLCHGKSCTEGNEFMNALLRKLTAELRAAGVPERPPGSTAARARWHKWAPYVDRRFGQLDPYLKLQVWMGIVMVRYLASCYADDEDAVCDTALVDWVYAIRSMDPSRAGGAWADLVNGEDAPRS